MKFIINIEDFWLDQESDLKPALKSYIVRESVNQIYEKLESKTQIAITTLIKERVDELIDEKMDIFVSQVIAKRKFKSDRYSSDLITIEEHITNQISGKSTNHSIEEAIKVAGSKFGEKIKERYDSIFASKIISQLENSGLLKEGVAKILLNDDNGK